jgi:hypothetical protein
MANKVQVRSKSWASPHKQSSHVTLLWSSRCLSGCGPAQEPPLKTHCGAVTRPTPRMLHWVHTSTCHTGHTSTLSTGGKGHTCCPQTAPTKCNCQCMHACRQAHRLCSHRVVVWATL